MITPIVPPAKEKKEFIYHLGGCYKISSFLNKKKLIHGGKEPSICPVFPARTVLRSNRSAEEKSFSPRAPRTSRARGEPNSLALPQGVLHAVPAELLVVVDEGEGQGDVQRVGSVRGGRPFARLERDHQVDPGRGALDLELFDKILSEYFTQKFFKFVIYA